MDLADAREALKEEIKQGLTILASRKTVGLLADTYETLPEQFEGLAICYLLEDANLESFRESLIRSAHARRWFLRRSRIESNVGDRHLGLSRTRAFLDAMVAGHIGLAREIAGLSPDQWDERAEYEDDFYYYLFLHALVLQSDASGAAALHAVLDRFERSLEGGKSVRLDVCRALLSRDAAAFEDALVALLDEEKSRIDADRSSTAVLEGDLLFWPNSFVSIEGLALLKLAELVGIPTRKNFPRCPPMARLPWTEHTSLNFYETIERS